MSTGVKAKKDLSEQEIDQIVIAQADDDSAWEKPVYVHRTKPVSRLIPADLAELAALRAQLHRGKNV